MLQILDQKVKVIFMSFVLKQFVQKVVKLKLISLKKLLEA
jgi:hypothetical protein